MRSDFRRIDEAKAAVRSRARGMSALEVRGLLVREMKARGMMLPPPIIDFYVKEIMLGGGPTRGLRRAHHGLANTAKFTIAVGRFLRSATDNGTAPELEIDGMRQVLSDPRRRRAEVMLDAGVAELLSICAHDLISVWLDRAAGTDGIAVFLGDDRVGLLGDEGNQAYGAAVDQAHDVNEILVTLALRSRADDGSWQMHIGLPFFPLLSAAHRGGPRQP